MTSLLSVNNISKTYSKTGKLAVSDVSFKVQHGDIVVFLGPNGAGKTTTLKIILNLVSPDKGNVFFEGENITSDNLILLKNTGALLEGSKNMFWALSPIENFVYWGGQRGLSKKTAEQKGLSLLKKFNLLDKKDTTVTRLSRGMQQIVGICCAMIAEPKLLLLDEPTLGLDLKSTQIMINMLKVLSKSGVGILVTTHQLDFAQKVANRILLIDHGKLVLSDSVKASLARLNQQTIFKVSFSRLLSKNERKEINTYCDLSMGEDKVYQLSLRNQADLPQVLRLLADLPIKKIETEAHDLEDIFEHYTR